MDVALLIRQRLSEIGMDQKGLAVATEVTESYISQLLARKKVPPAPGRTDIYEKIGRCLGIPGGELARLAELQRGEELKKKMEVPPAPLFRECRELVLRKCHVERRGELRRIFEKGTFGELERLVTQKILDVAQGVARDELRSESWLRLLAELSGRSYEQMRVAILEFLDSDIFHVSVEGCVSFLEPMVDYWDIDLKSFGMEIVLNSRLALGSRKRFAFAEVAPERPVEAGFAQFLDDRSLSGGATDEELALLRSLRFEGRCPSALYYYRELQSLRDPLHFLAPE